MAKPPSILAEIPALIVTPASVGAHQQKSETPLGLSLPLHILVSGDHTRRKTRMLKTHCGLGPFPYGCFLEVGEGFMVSSPEYCFYQMASSLSLIELIQLGYELCGTYSLVNDNAGSASLQPHGENGFVACPPLTNVVRLSKMLAKLQGSYASSHAFQAVRYLANNAASPMETNLVMLLSLPYRHGGYGLPLPLLNYPIESGTANYRCDLYWPKAKLAVEYDSDQFHTGAERIARDSVRRGALALLGVSVVTVTWRQVRSSEKFRELAQLLSSNLGKRLKLKDPQFTQNHLALKSQLF